MEKIIEHNYVKAELKFIINRSKFNKVNKQNNP